MADRIGVGVVGLGFIGPVHVDAVRRLGFAEVVAVAGSSAERARAQADALSVPHSHGDWRELVERADIQVVHVCTPNDTHHPITKAALLAGKHVISEKPLAMDTTQSAELTALARERGLVNAVAFTYRGYATAKQARAMVAAGEIGDVRLVHGGYVQDWLTYPTDYNWRVEPKLSGASRAIADIGSHWFDMAEYITGRRVRRVFASLRTFMPTRRRPRGSALAFSRHAGADADEVQVTTEDAGIVMLELDNGALASTVVSQVSPGRKNALTVEVDGSEAALFWNQEQAERLWVGRRNEPSYEIVRDPGQMDPSAAWAARTPAGHPEGWPSALRTVFEPAYRQILAGGVEPGGDYPRFEDGHRAMQFVEAVVRSHAEVRWVDM
jgi:predicted dehydrogenase